MNLIYLLAPMGGAAGGTSTATGGNQWTFIIMIGVMVLMMFFMNRSQKKKQKEEQAKRDNVQIGDEITTIGGIMGRIVTVKEDSIVIETGADRTRIKFQRWAIQTNNTAEDRLQAERAAQAAAKEAEKAEKGKGRRSKKADKEEE